MPRLARTAVTAITLASFVAGCLSGCAHTEALLDQAQSEHYTANLDSWDLMGAAPAPDGQLDVCVRLHEDDGTLHEVTLHIPVRDPSQLNGGQPFYEYRVQTTSFMPGCHLRGAPMGLLYSGGGSTSPDAQNVVLDSQGDKVPSFSYFSRRPLFGDVNRVEVPVPDDHSIRMDHQPQYLLYTMLPLTMTWDAGDDAWLSTKAVIAYPQIILVVAAAVACLAATKGSCNIGPNANFSGRSSASSGSTSDGGSNP